MKFSAPHQFPQIPRAKALWLGGLFCVALTALATGLLYGLRMLLDASAIGMHVITATGLALAVLAIWFAANRFVLRRYGWRWSGTALLAAAIMATAVFVACCITLPVAMVVWVSPLAGLLVLGLCITVLGRSTSRLDYVIMACLTMLSVAGATGWYMSSHALREQRHIERYVSEVWLPRSAPLRFAPTSVVKQRANAQQHTLELTTPAGVTIYQRSLPAHAIDTSYCPAAFEAAMLPASRQDCTYFTDVRPGVRAYGNPDKPQHVYVVLGNNLVVINATMPISEIITYARSLRLVDPKTAVEVLTANNKVVADATTHWRQQLKFDPIGIAKPPAGWQLSTSEVIVQDPESPSLRITYRNNEQHVVVLEVGPASAKFDPPASCHPLSPTGTYSNSRPCGLVAGKSYYIGEDGELYLKLGNALAVASSSMTPEQLPQFIEAVGPDGLNTFNNAKLTR